MLKRSQVGDGDSRNQPPPAPPSFLSLPDLAHTSIASFLPDGNKGNDSCLRVAEVSRALLESYGGSLNEMRVHYVAGSSAARLAVLLRRNRKLSEVIVQQQEAIPALCLAVVQGCCRRIERLYLFEGGDVMTQAILDLLAGALEVDGPLAGLELLQVSCTLPGGLAMFARVLARDAAPLLQRFYFDETGSNEAEMIALADMIEACARIPGCKKIEKL